MGHNIDRCITGLVFVSLGSLGLSAQLVLRLAIAVIDSFSYRNAERLRMHIH